MQSEDRRKLEFVRQATDAMAQQTFGCICSVVGVESSQSGELVGSGFRISDGDQRWLVTAHHVVVKAARRFGRLAVTAVRERPPIELAGDPLIDRQADVAIFPLPAEFPLVATWPLSRIERATDILDTDFLFLHGFPGKSARFSPLLQAMMSKSFPYGVMKCDDNLPDDLIGVNSRFAMDFQPSSLQRLDNGPDGWLDPHGLSGSAVWRIGAAGLAPEAWSPSGAQLVGVLTQWRPSEHLLVATTADAIIDLLSDPLV